MRKLSGILKSRPGDLGLVMQPLKEDLHRKTRGLRHRAGTLKSDAVGMELQTKLVNKDSNRQMNDLIYLARSLKSGQEARGSK